MRNPDHPDQARDQMKINMEWLMKKVKEQMKKGLEVSIKYTWLFDGTF